MRNRKIIYFIYIYTLIYFICKRVSFKVNNCSRNTIGVKQLQVHSIICYDDKYLITDYCYEITELQP